METIRLQNFRSFADTGRKALRPITLLVGANSSGKSSYLRFFPLLRQTVETPTGSPLLWFGPLVDFGDFHQVVMRGSEPSAFRFEVELVVALPTRTRRAVPEWIPLKVDVSVRSREGAGTYVSAMTVILFGEDTVTIRFGPDDDVTALVCNGSDMLTHFGNEPFRLRSTSLFPTFGGLGLYPDYDVRYTPIHRAIANFLKTLAHNRTSEIKLLGYANHLRYGPTSKMLEGVRTLALRHLPDPQASDPVFTFLRKLLLAKDIGSILRAAHHSDVRRGCELSGAL